MSISSSTRAIGQRWILETCSPGVLTDLSTSITNVGRYRQRKMTWLAEDFPPPELVELTSACHMRPIRESDVDIDFPAVMGSRERLWKKYGEAWGWPSATLSHEADRRDLARHEAEIAG